MISSVSTYGLADAYDRPAEVRGPAAYQAPEQIARELAATDRGPDYDVPPDHCCARCWCPLTILAGDAFRPLCVGCQEEHEAREKRPGAYGRQGCRLCPRPLQLTRRGDLCGVCRDRTKRKRRAA